MSTKIELTNHLNGSVYHMENDKLSVKVLKDFGAKIVSIYNKELDYEALFQPTLGKYTEPKLGDSFEEYDTSGLDDTFPTIDSCFYPNSYVKLNDHGDVWAQKWDIKIEGESLVCKVRSDTLKLDLTRKMTLVGDTIKFEYKVKNPTKQDHYYLWAFHGLMNFDDSTEMEFDFDGEIENVIDGSEYDFDYLKLKEYPDNKAYKFYFKDEIQNGRARIINKDKNVEIEYDFDTEINKYLGVWITKGGFKGEYNLAIEPSSGYYDSLERAFLNNKFSKIDSFGEKNWRLDLRVGKWR